MEQPASSQGIGDIQISPSQSPKARAVRQALLPNWMIGPLVCITTMVLYAIASAVGLRFVLKPEGITSVWPACGVALAIMALTDWRRWGWVLLGAALGEIPGNMGVSRPFPAVCFYTLANVTETLIAACILTRFGRDRIDFTRVGHHLRLFLVVGPANALTAALAAGPVVYFGYAPNFWEFWRLWFVADGLGILLITPVILGARTRKHIPLSHQRVIEATYLLFGSGLIASVIFLFKRPTSPLLFDLPFVFTIPLILWAALRTNVSITSWISLIFSTIAVIGTLNGLGPFAGRGGSVQTAIVSLQIVIMAWTTCGLIISVATVQHREGLHKLQEREARFHLLAANSPAAVFLTNSTGECIYMNDRWEEISGQPACDALGRGWSNAVHPEDVSRVKGRWRKAGDGNMDVLAEYRVRRPSGEVRWLSRRLAQIKSAAGVLQGYVGIAMDVTDRIQMERELEDRLRFEILIADISNTLVNVPAEEVDPAVDRALRALCDLLDVDRATLSERSLETRGAHIVRAYVRAGATRSPSERTDLDHPWLWQQMDAGKVVAVKCLDELPPEAALDRATLLSRATKSFVLVPISVGGIVRFAFSVATIQRECAWPEDLPRQLRVLGETIANSIVRASADLDLRRREAMLSRLNAELLRAEDNERRRLATALHDDLAQTLFAATVQLVALRDRPSPQVSAASLQPTISILDGALRQTRDLTFELCPPALYELGLHAALGKLVEQFQRRFGLACSLSEDDAETPLDPDVAGLLYQAVRELLMNIVKHSGVKAADIRLEHVDNKFCVTVSDEGKGIPAPCDDSKHLRSGFGLFNIKERLRSLGGNVEITSGSGVGCRVCLTIPGNLIEARARESS